MGVAKALSVDVRITNEEEGTGDSGRGGKFVYQGSVESGHDTPPLSRNLAPLALHALPQCEREHLLHPAARLRGALDVLGADFACDLRALA